MEDQGREELGCSEALGVRTPSLWELSSVDLHQLPEGLLECDHWCHPVVLTQEARAGPAMCISRHYVLAVQGVLQVPPHHWVSFIAGLAKAPLVDTSLRLYILLCYIPIVTVEASREQWSSSGPQALPDRVKGSPSWVLHILLLNFTRTLHTGHTFEPASEFLQWEHFLHLRIKLQQAILCRVHPTQDLTACDAGQAPHGACFLISIVSQYLQSPPCDTRKSRTVETKTSESQE